MLLGVFRIVREWQIFGRECGSLVVHGLLKAGAGRRKTEDGSMKSGAGSWELGAGRPKTEDRRPKTEAGSWCAKSRY